MRYFRARERAETQNAAFRLYTAKGIQLLTEGLVSVHLVDFSDLIDNKPKDNRSGDEIAADIINRAGLTFGGDES